MGDSEMGMVKKMRAFLADMRNVAEKHGLCDAGFLWINDDRSYVPQDRRSLIETRTEMAETQRNLGIVISQIEHRLGSPPRIIVTQKGDNLYTAHLEGACEWEVAKGATKADAIGNLILAMAKDEQIYLAYQFEKGEKS